MRRRWSLIAMAAPVLVCALALAGLPVAGADESPVPPKPLEVTLERMAEILARLDQELAAVDRPAADRLEGRVEEAAALVERLIVALESEEPASAPRKGAVELGLMLHRLVGLLEDIVGAPDRRPEQARARPALEELRAWVDGYVAALTAGMTPREAERLDRVARELARALLGQVARTAKQGTDSTPSPARLPGIVARLEALTLRLNALLERWAEKQEPAPNP